MSRGRACSLVLGVTLTAASCGKHSPTQHKSTPAPAPHDAGCALARSPEDMVAFPAGPPPVPHAGNLSLPCPVPYLPAFQIDRRVVTCNDYNACVQAGACPEDTYQCGPPPNGPCAWYEGTGKDYALVTLGEAQAYCAWRGAELPSVAEWQRAVRGPNDIWQPDDAEWATARRTEWDKEDDKAVLRFGHGLRNLRLELTSHDGVVFSVDDKNGEWTRDFTCTSKYVARGIPVVVAASETYLGVWNAIGPGPSGRSEFRCRKPEPPHTPANTGVPLLPAPPTRP